jgi:hypothetical protein
MPFVSPLLTLTFFYVCTRNHPLLLALPNPPAPYPSIHFSLSFSLSRRSYSVTLQRITPPTLDESNYDCALEISGRRSPVRCGSPLRYSGLDALEISDRRSPTHIQNVVEYVQFPVRHTQAQIISGDLSSGWTLGDTTYRYSGGSGRSSSPPGTVLFSVHSSPPETVFEPKGYPDSLVETPQPSHFSYFSNSFHEVRGHELITT